MDNDFAKCPNCGADSVTVSTERIRPNMGACFPLLYLLALVLILWQGFERMARPYTTQSAYNEAVALAVVAVVFAVALTAYFVACMRKRPCRVQRCQRCGHVIVLEKPVRWSKGWRVD